MAKRPKLYFLDTGMCAYLTEWTSPETLEAGAMSGAMFETHGVAEILKSWWHRGRRPGGAGVTGVVLALVYFLGIEAASRYSCSADRRRWAISGASLRAALSLLARSTLSASSPA